MKSLENRICLITGAARGLGAEIAREFARQGAKVILTDINAAAMKPIAAEIQSASQDFLCLEHDVSSELRWQEIMDITTDRFGGLDVVVNNAGIVINGPVWKTSLEQWRAISRINLDGVFLGTKHAVLAMKGSDRRNYSSGSIINMSSVGGLRGTAGLSAYCMTKGGVRFFTKAVAAECGQYNIRANTIHPGMIDTEMGMSALRARFPGKSDDAIRKAAGEPYPLRRIGTVGDVAKAAVFLASENSSFVSGTEIIVDGGLTGQS